MSESLIVIFSDSNRLFLVGYFFVFYAIIILFSSTHDCIIDIKFGQH